MTTRKEPRNPDHVRSRRMSAPTSEQIEEHLGLLLKPAVYRQLARYRQLGLRNRILSFPKFQEEKKKQLNELKVAAQEGFIRLKYLDEMGKDGESMVTYTWMNSGEQKCIPQPKKLAPRQSILGIWEPDKDFKYALIERNFTSEELVLGDHQ